MKTLSIKNGSMFSLSLAPVIGGALIAGGSQLLGGLLDGIGADQASEAEMEQKAKELSEQRRQFGLNLGQRKEEFQRNSGFKGLNFLAQQRAGAMQQGRQRSFRNDVITSMRGL